VASRVRLWLDARAPGPTQLDDWWEAVRQAAATLERRTGVEVSAVVASLNRGTEFDSRVRAALLEAAGGEEVVCFAGHDAGVIAQRRPAGMVLVRNSTGVSHAPAEHVELEDAAVAARVVQTALEALA
jgi:N-carbamoyl-L-amino-acid hydrolase